MKKTKWCGVYHEPERRLPWAVMVRARTTTTNKTGKLFRLINFADPMHAVLAADLAKYLFWGQNPSTWYSPGARRPPDPPNTSPKQNLPFDPQIILDKLGDSEWGQANKMTLFQNWDAYKEEADRPDVIAAWKAIDEQAAAARAAQAVQTATPVT